MKPVSSTSTQPVRSNPGDSEINYLISFRRQLFILSVIIVIIANMYPLKNSPLGAPLAESGKTPSNEPSKEQEMNRTSRYEIDYPSLAELKRQIATKKWTEFEIEKKRFFIAQISLEYIANSREDIVCWCATEKLDHFVCAWKLRINGMNATRIEIDKLSSKLSVICVENGEFKNKEIASVILSTLGF